MLKKFLLCFFIITSCPLALQAKYKKETITFAIPFEPPHLDPTATAADPTAEIVYGNIFEGLTQINQNGEVIPCLAKSWKISQDGKLYIFELQKGVKFHNGQDFTAKDVIYTFERAKAPDSINDRKEIFQKIKNIRALDLYKVEFELEEVFGEFIYYLGMADAIIVSPSSSHVNKILPVGTGPYTLKKWTKGHSIELIPFEGYWGRIPAIKEATFRFIPDPIIQMTYLIAGDVDAIPNLAAPEAIEKLKGDNNFVVDVGFTEGEVILTMNNQKPPFNDIRVRKAITHAIKKQDIIDGAYLGYGTPIGSHFSPNHPAYVDLTDMVPYNLEDAKKLLVEAGFPDGFETTLKLPPITYARRSGEVIAEQLAQIGIKVKLVSIEWSAWLENVFRNKEYDMTIIAHTEPLDISNYARENYYYNNDQSRIKPAISLAHSSFHTEERFLHYKEAQKILAEQAFNVYLFQLPKIGVWRKNLKGMWKHSPIQATIITDIYWEEE